MSSSYLKKLWNDTGVGAIIILLIIAFGIGSFGKYISNKSSMGPEFMSQNSKGNVYKNTKTNSNSTGVKPSEPLGFNETYSSVSGIGTPSIGVPTSCTQPNIQNPADLLPKDTN